MMSILEWNEEMRSHARVAYVVVEREARLLLDNLDPKMPPLTTHQLVEALYPRSEEDSDRGYTRNRIYKAFEQLQDHGLRDYTYRGEPKMLLRHRQMIRPRLWHRPSVAVPIRDKQSPEKALRAVTCPNCGTKFDA